MIIIGVSDTHGKHDQVNVPNGDVLIHCGDFSNRGTPLEFEEFLHWFSKQPHTHKIMIPGNHDWCLEQNEGACRSLVKAIGGVNLLIDESIEIMGFKIYGSPWTPKFGNWSFMRSRSAMSQIWSKIPNDTDILVTHGPPYGHNDFVPARRGMGRVVGCLELTKRVYELDLLLHMFGHIHAGYGQSKCDSLRTQFVNCAMCDETYSPTNLPQIINV